MLSRKFLKYLSSFQARMKTIFEMSEVPVKQVVRASSSATVRDRVAGVAWRPQPCAEEWQWALQSREWVCVFQDIPGGTCGDLTKPCVVCGAPV